MAATRDQIHVDVDPSVGFDEWAALARDVLARAEASPWEVGDVLLAARRIFVDALDEADQGRGMAKVLSALVEITTLDPPHLWDCMATAERFPPETRWVEVSWSHHAELLSLDDDAAVDLLARAAEGEWSRAELRQAKTALLAERRAAAEAAGVEGPRSQAKARAQVVIVGDLGLLDEVRATADLAARAARMFLAESGVEAEVTVR